MIDAPVSTPAVWVLFDRHEQDAAIAGALGLRRAANEHRCRGQRRDADELDRLADDLERIIVHVQAAYREAHPPGERTPPAPSVQTRNGRNTEPGEGPTANPTITDGGPS